MKKITIIGRGTAGAFAAAHFAKQTNWHIDWIYDPNIKQQAVGEGTNLTVPMKLEEDLDFNVVELQSIFGTPKLGIRKMNWGTHNSDFTHTFPGRFHGYHFNAVMLQDFIIEKLKANNRVNLIHDHVSNHDQLDSDFVLDCSGRPTDFTDFDVRTEIPVNAVSVKQCYWEGMRFTQTLTIARPHGWVFGIPLLNRCAIGYLYNKDISTLEEVEQDAENIYREFNLVPSQDGNKFAFGNYTRKQNFTDRVAYNGNASFFLEPLEATSLSSMIFINNLAYKIFNKKMSVEEANEKYKAELDSIEYMIMLHYFAGSTFDTPFWKMALERSYKSMANAKSNSTFTTMVAACNMQESKRKMVFSTLDEYGTWPGRSYLQNLEGLGIKEKLNQFLKGS
jgi:tryptophan halogenase